MIVYFSGTGNSRYAAELLARQLGDDILDAGIQIEAGERGQLHSERPAHKAGAVDRLKSGFVNGVLYKLFVKADAFYATDACIGCGKCVTACPLNNIRLSDGRPAWGKGCTHCMACICGCPAQAIEYGKKIQGKPRYQCPGG